MAISDALNKRLRARRDEEDDFEDEVSDEMEDIDKDDESNSDVDRPNSESEESAELEEGSEEEDDDDDDISDNQSTASTNDKKALQSEFRQISFGALAKAQNSISKKRKRGEEPETDDKTQSTLNDIRERLRKAREQKLGLTRDNETKNNNSGGHSKPKPPTRSSKHAPTVQSSKMAVSRKRIVIEPPSNATKPRDPRFDPAVSSSSARRNSTSNAYTFLDEYRASEIKQLKDQLARTKDPKQREELKRQLTSAEDRQRTLENKKREREVLREHKQREKQLIKEGKKSQPYFLKKSELKKEVLKKKYESMGSRQRTKALERRRKKIAAKGKKDLPWARRGVE
ncbi:pre-rRNA processing protein, putative [Talaromyces stipitatus ATCC 10500]|uniref:rRNA biogenesis protein rrp36 n=1 Tax=Talaromyces stipitatus (strain ATCC 10500 / CBS 375.48 / QM 6759 / NRRL 1006) TaxID=441959 RepID=RRP36_TALSN|nr:pre-rRNA processing protein, putative [Talaromyces stipitatus ATCC 10500]B8MSM6.1 RecName: Full=rRNA biogenesis protein rrp36; AltName: Full=Ribosomal RNA-processing protein 36 [Talaromyces stipitatus ATCC 10500]EED12463.1 pre-rRNA processing protein, putative [Talaromyces stipitatus ATCC 10500]